MPDDSSGLVVAELEQFVRPLELAVESEYYRRELFRGIGTTLDEGPEEEFLDACSTIIDGVATLVEYLEEPPENLDDYLSIIEHIGSFVGAIETLVEIFEGGNATSSEALLEDVGSALVTHLVLLYLESSHPILTQIGVLLAVVRPAVAGTEIQRVSPDREIITRHTEERATIEPSVIPDLLSDPGGTLKREYFGTDGPIDVDDAERAMDKLGPRLVTLFSMFGVEIQYSGTLTDHDVGIAGVGEQIGRFRLSIAEFDDGPEFGLLVLPFATEDGSISVVLEPYGEVEFSERFGAWTLEIDLAASVAAIGFGPDGVLLPDDGASGTLSLAVRGTLTGPEEPSPSTGIDESGTEDGEATDTESEDEEHALVVGGRNSTRLEVGELTFEGEAEISPDDMKFGVLAKASDSSFVLDAGDGDSFLSEVLPSDGIGMDFDLGLGWSTERSVYVEGSSTLEATLPIGLSLGGVLFVDAVELAITPTPGGDGQTARVPVKLGTTATVKLGPLVATVQNVGLEVAASFPESGDGNLGPVDLAFGFKPPTGIGISIDSGALTGGGFLQFDYENERYAGILQLQIGDISITAIGLLTTRLPDGSSGFSMLVLITGEFTPIQLGLGFTLNGLGGLLGINRSFKTDPLRQAVKTGSLDSVLFPENPVANAQRIISDLRAIFPPTRDLHVFGPLARLGWGSPTLVTLDLGIVLEIPSFKIAILGRIDVTLPTEEAAVVELHLDVLGLLDPPGERASLNARLYDSRVAAFTVSGEMAMRTSWGDEPRFVLSVGGFHPQFQPPEDIGEIERVRVALGEPNGNPSLEVTGYFAVTSNTVQVGAHLKLRAEAGPVSVKGHFGFDALFQFDPFKFVVAFVAGIEVKVFGASLGISLEGMLSGPEPYRIQGRIKISLFLLTVEANLDVTIGSEGETQPLPKANILPELTAVLSTPANWTAQRPMGGESLVTLRSIEPDPDRLLAHPLGRVGVRQTIVPLEERIETFGNARPAPHDRFTIDEVTTGGTAAGEGLGKNDLELDSSRVALENFAPAQYQEMTDGEKLESPAFERKPAGRTFDNDLVYLGGDTEADLTGNVRTTVLDYEESIIDDSKERPFLTPIWKLGAYSDVVDRTGYKLSIQPNVAAAFAELGSAARRSALGGIDLSTGVAGGPAEPSPTDTGSEIDPQTGLLTTKIRLHEPSYVLVTADDGTALDVSDAMGAAVDGDGVSMSKATAQRTMSRFRSESPELADGVRVVEKWRAKTTDDGRARTVEEAFPGVAV